MARSQGTHPGDETWSLQVVHQTRYGPQRTQGQLWKESIPHEPHDGKWNAPKDSYFTNKYILYFTPFFKSITIVPSYIALEGLHDYDKPLLIVHGLVGIVGWACHRGIFIGLKKL